MKEIITGSIGLIVGLVMVIFNRPLSRAQIKSQNDFWGFNYGEKEIAVSRIVILIVGVGFLIFGLLALFHIIRFK
jgi:hypothetical protein